MKNMNKVLSAAGLSATLLLIAGCSTPTITADYVMPPAAIKDIKSVDTLEIIAKTDISGSAVKTGTDHSYANGALAQRVAARFCQEGYFRTTDLAWGNPNGVSRMGQVIASKNSKHGYARYSTDPVMPRANLQLDLQVKIDAGTVRKEIPIVLKDIPYKRTDANGIPSSAPDPLRTKEMRVMQPIDVYMITGKGVLTAKLTDKNGKLVYEKTFNDLNYHFETSQDVHAALPTNAAVAVEMILPAVEVIVADLSPHKESKTNIINKKGDEKAVLLLEAQAFTEAISQIDSIEEDDKTFADYENLGLAYEVIGDYNAAKSAFEKAQELDSNAEIAKDGIERIDTILAGKEELRKMDAKKTDTQYKKSEFK